MTHHVFTMTDTDAKKDVVTALASGMGRRILFMRTKHHAKKLAKQLTSQGIPAVDLHGNLSQPQRDRNLAAFSAGTAKVLVATDVAARGVHVDDVELVIHVDPPMEHKAYLHRSGRTARAGAEGAVVTLVLPGQEKDVAQLLRKAAISVAPVRVTATSTEVVGLVGEVAPYVKPEPVQRPAQGGGRSQGANAQRKRAAREQGGSGSGRGDGGRRGGQPRAAGASAAGRTQEQGAGRARGQGSGRAQGTGRASDRAQASHQRSDQSAGHTRSSQPAQGNPRTPGRRASSGGTGKLMVGSVVRQNGGNRRTGR
jgi:superfamily II DNA/RNA helicase